MEVKVPYGKDGEQKVLISDSMEVNFLTANDVAIGDQADVIKNAVADPIESKSLTDFLSLMPKMF